MTRRFAYLLLVGGLLSACAPGTRAAKRQAEVDFSCDGSELEVSRRSNDTYIVHGCGRTGIYQCPTAVGTSHRWCVNLALLAQRRHAAEFSCPERSVSVGELSPYVFRTSGCETSTVFYCTASDGNPRCTVDQAAAE